MNNSNNISNFAFVMGLITIFSRLIKWITVSILSFVKTFRTTILWMIVALIVLFMGKPAMIVFGVVALITAIIALVPLAVVLRNIGGKFGDDNDKVRNVFNNIADIVEKFYPAFRKAVRVVSFVPDFQRFGNKINRLKARKAANDLFYDNEIFVIPEGFLRRKDFDLYLQREYHGKVVKNAADPGHYVFYVGKGKNVLPQGMTAQQVDMVVNDFLFEYTGAQQVNSVPLSKNPYFSKKYEFINDMPAEQVEGNEFIRFDAGIVPETDGSFYDVVANQTHNGFKVVFNEQVDRNTSGVIQKLNDYAKNNSVKYVNIDQQLGGKLSVDYILDVDKDVDDANDLLRNVGIIQKDDKKLYSVSLSDNSVGNPVLVINEQIGYQTVENVYDQLVKVRSNFGSKYVDLKQKNTANDPWMTFEYIRTIDKDVERAHDLLKEAKVLDNNNAEIYDIKLTVNSDEANFVLGEHIRGVPTQNLVNSVKGYKDRFDAKVIRVVKQANGNTEIKFIIRDFLDETTTIDRLLPVNVQDMSVACAVDAYGNDISLPFESTPGCVMSGIPGSGKTAAANAIFGALIVNKHTEFTLIDCKGGDDWIALVPAATNYIKGADSPEKVERIAQLLEKEVDEMNERIRTNRSKIGNSNFWNASPEEREKAGLKFKIIIIDECQDVFGKKSAKKDDPYSRIEESATQIVKKGRSAGVVLVAITQKPSQSSLPIDIRDNSDRRISLRMLEERVVNMILGDSRPSNAPSPVDIPPNRKGGAVIRNEIGEYIEVRFYYIPEDILEKKIKEELKKNGKPEYKHTEEDENTEDSDSTENTEETRSSRRTNNRFDKEEKVNENTRRTSRASNREKEARKEEAKFHNSSKQEEQKEKEERTTGKEQTNSHNSSKTQESNESKKTEQPVVKVEKAVFDRKVKIVKSMLLKANDKAASDDERDTARSRAASLMKRFGITENDLK